MLIPQPIGKARGHIDGERRARRLEDRIGDLKRVAIAVVEGKANKTPTKIALDQAPVHLVEADDIEPGAAQVGDDAAEKARRDFEQPIGLEAARPRRPHVMERQNGPDAAEQRLEHAMRAGEIQRFQPAADDCRFECPHDGHALIASADH
jgi:hypothetical protein